MFARRQIFHLINKYDQSYPVTDETGWNYYLVISEEVIKDLKQFYIPKFYNQNGQYVETSNLEEFIIYGSPYGVLDVVEIFAEYSTENDFAVQLNQILELNNLSLKMVNGQIESLYINQLKSNIQIPIYEIGLKELIEDAMRYYEEDNINIAVEKLWDAFERLKTFYAPELNKKESAKKIIDKMSNKEENFTKMFEKEFQELTAIGNAYRIRHHERNKIDIVDKRHADYLYKRCLTLISTAIQYLNLE